MSLPQAPTSATAAAWNFGWPATCPTATPPKGPLSCLRSAAPPRSTLALSSCQRQCERPVGRPTC
eukprot:2251597-Lingulodinium_polyedra.AAC.1